MSTEIPSLPDSVAALHRAAPRAKTSGLGATALKSPTSARNHSRLGKRDDEKPKLASCLELKPLYLIGLTQEP